MFLAFFGGVWLALASWANHPGNALQLGAIALIGALLFLLGLLAVQRHPDPKASRAHSAAQAREWKRFGMLNGVQWGAITALIAALNIAGRPDWITPGIMLIVGLHFLPLAAMFRYRPHLITGSLLTVLALSYPFLIAGGPASPVGPVCAGLIIWGSAIGMLIDIARHERH